MAHAQTNLMPWPRSVALDGTSVMLPPGVVTWAGYSSARLEAEALRLRAHLPSITIDCGGAAPDFPQLGDDESYRLEIGSDGNLSLRAANEWGVVRGLATLVQLRDDDEIPVGVIEDAPRFPWRGLMVDVARHFMSVDALERTLEAMAFVKLNVLHLHLTDDQGFRFPSTAYPKLAEVGGRGEFYSRDELRGLVARAAALGIRVVPEIDVPGHVTSWLTAHPELGGRAERVEPSDRFGVHEAALDPSNEHLYPVLETLFGEVKAVFPDAFLHIGGDEVEGSWWRDSAPIQRFMEMQDIADAADLQAHFNQRLSKQLRWLGRRMMGWDEVIDARLPDQVVVQSWRGARSRDRALAHGFDCVFSAGYYLDLFYPADVHYAFDPEAEPEELDRVEAAMLDDPRLAHVRRGLSWSRRFAEQAGRDDAAPARPPGRVLGGEACIWAELVTEALLDQRIWGRLPAVAERLWSPKEVADVGSMYRRLDGVVARLPEVSAVDLDRDLAAALARLGIDPALKPLIDVLEPVKWYLRLLGEDVLAARTDAGGERELVDLRPYKATTTLDRLVDVLPPESRPARALSERIAAGDATLRAVAREWQGIPDAPGELAPLADSLRALGALLEQCLEGSVPADAHATLMRAGATHAELVVAVVPAVENLVERLDARA